MSAKVSVAPRCRSQDRTDDTRRHRHEDSGAHEDQKDRDLGGEVEAATVVAAEHDAPCRPAELGATHPSGEDEREHESESCVHEERDEGGVVHAVLAEEPRQEAVEELQAGVDPEHDPRELVAADLQELGAQHQAPPIEPGPGGGGVAVSRRNTSSRVSSWRRICSG